MKRRKFINYFFGGSLTATLLSFLYPVIRYLIPPGQQEAVIKRIVAAKVGELAPNSAKIIKFGSAPAILIHTQEGEFKAFAATCTHLSCTVIYESQTGTILCPCHNGRFDLSGKVISGPPPLPLPSFNVEVSATEIAIFKKD